MNEIRLRMRISLRLKCRKSSLNEREQTHTLRDLISKRPKQSLLFVGIQYRRRVVDLPVYAFRSWKLGTLRLRTIAQSNDEIETEIQKITYCFRYPSAQVDSDLFHNLNCKRVCFPSIDTSANYLKMFTIYSVQQCFRDWTLHTIGFTQE